MLCKNCKIAIDSTDNYCKNCGGKIIKKRLTIQNLFEHFSAQFLNYDNLFLQTFICLFTKPEDVIGGYIDGVRKKYINPISYFALAITLAGFQIYIIKTFFPEGLDLSNITIEGQEEFANSYFSFIQDYQSLILPLFVPAYALMSKIVFYNYKKYNYTEHLVTFLYILSQLTIAMILPVITFTGLGYTYGDFTMFTIIFQITYSAYCLKRVFALSFKKLLLKTLLFFVVFSLLYVLAIILFIAIMIMIYGGLEGFAEAFGSISQ
ncbi:DUF3667 domain-containing protein [Hanstruepera flava]|uniref:DUF3667 domain-containing protein n=1 Tax=Hanstruepera flava TaxID=2930218 RepID=UPI0020288B98|nr:DUF3667 domain-containing protein [Hanstruepera flava]